MKCPNCGNDMKEEIEEVMGEKFKRWYCEKCDTYYTLVAEDYLKSLERDRKYEPLRGKSRLIKILEGLRRTDGSELKMWFLNRGFLAKDVKSATQGLLKDIEKLESEIIDEYKNEWLNTAMKHYCISLLNECKGLVKKWYSDAFKEEKR